MTFAFFVVAIVISSLSYRSGKKAGYRQGYLSGRYDQREGR